MRSTQGFLVKPWILFYNLQVISKRQIVSLGWCEIDI